MGLNRAGMPPVYLGLALGVLAVSFAAILIRLADAPPLAIAAYRLSIASLVIAPLTLGLSRGSPIHIPPKALGLALASALFLALHFASWIASLGLTSVASSVVLVSASPLLVALASRLLLKEHLHWRVYAGILLGMVGSLIIGSGDWGGGGADELLGDFLALIGAVGATGYLLIGRRLRPHLPLMPYIAVVYTVTALVLLFLAAATRSPLSGYTGQTYLMLVLLALVPQVMGHSLLNWALARVSATIVAVSIRAEPVIATILALLILGEIPRLTSIIGGIVIIAGVYLAVVSPAVPERAGRR